MFTQTKITPAQRSETINRLMAGGWHEYNGMSLWRKFEFSVVLDKFDGVMWIQRHCTRSEGVAQEYALSTDAFDINSPSLAQWMAQRKVVQS
jgi:hypothetical protein